jgi:hypothetical protein
MDCKLNHKARAEFLAQLDKDLPFQFIIKSLTNYS